MATIEELKDGSFFYAYGRLVGTDEASRLVYATMFSTGVVTVYQDSPGKAVLDESWDLFIETFLIPMGVLVGV